MIEIKNATKFFDELKVLDELNFNIKDGSILGVIGSNGAGKSTLFRTISGIYSLDKGQITFDNEPVYNNTEVKKEIFYLSDTPLIEFGITLKKLVREYSDYYGKMDFDEYKKLIHVFGLDENAPLADFSKGMIRQAMIIIALCCNTKYLILDESLDGLDIMIRNLVKKKLFRKVIDNNATVIISSHSLKELEDFCDSLILIHEGSLILNQQLEDINTSISKIQFIPGESGIDNAIDSIDVIRSEKSGVVYSMLVKGNDDEVMEKLKHLNPKLLEIVPLTLEETFTYELESRGYAIDYNEIDS